MHACAVGIYLKLILYTHDPAETSDSLAPGDIIPCLQMDDMWIDAKMPELLTYLRGCSHLSLPEGWDELVPRSF